MSIESQMNRIEANVADAYNAVQMMGGDLPELQNSDNLPDTILSVKGAGSFVLSITFYEAFLGQPYTVTGGGEEYTGVVPANLRVKVTVQEAGTRYTVTSSTAYGVSRSASVVIGDVFGVYGVHLNAISIYGASWDGTSTTRWTRTDDAAEFTDPVPYVAEADSYSSPFDNRLPWSGMTISQRAGGTMVAIPKFWYKITQTGSGMKIQIADGAAGGFSPSPAHMDRGDGKGERDVAYIGRYHCASDYTSRTGVIPVRSVTRSAARSGIHNLGENIWQADFAMRFTIWLLYIVEFADWNSQNTIGMGCGNGGAQAMGYTDSMPYHTGTTQNSRDNSNFGTQYRNIEGLWDNVFDWCDGCCNSAMGLNIILNPDSFSDSGGASAGKPANGNPSAFTTPETAGFKMFVPTAAKGSIMTYSCDGWVFDAANPCVYVGGAAYPNTYYGMFYVGCGGASSTVGSRLQELP